MPIRRGTVSVNPEGHYFIKGLRQIVEKIIVRGVRLLRDRLGTSDCTGNLPLKKYQTKTKHVQTRIFVTLSLEFVTHWYGLKSEKVFEKSDCPEDFSRSSSSSPKAHR